MQNHTTMKAKGYLAVIVAIVFFSSSFANATSSLDELVIHARPAKQSFDSTEFPMIVGVIKDQQGQRVSDVQVKIAFATETVSSTTNEMGSFMIQTKTLSNPGNYMVSSIAIKEGYKMAVSSTTYLVTEKASLISPVLEFSSDGIEEIQKAVYTIPKTLEQGLTNNPLSQLITQRLEEFQRQQAEDEKRQMEIKQHNAFIDEQRKLAEQSLQKDLKGLEKDTEFNSARNAYARFVADVDEAVQSIFWGQFNFIEKKTTDAQEAKQSAIQSGKTSFEATKIFQRKAAITHEELISYNSELNVRFGSADKKIQESFNEDGKSLSRISLHSNIP